jgi:hypothetical protein
MVDYEMQITGENVSYDGSGKFEFPVNPKVITFPLTMDRNVIEIPYGLHHVIVTGGGVKTRELVLNGTFFGSDKLSDYNDLSEFIISKDLCRFYLTSTSFYYVIGSGIRQSLSNEKINFIDYVATFLTASPFVYSTARTVSTNAITDGTETSTPSLTNTGNAPSVAKITITNNGAGSAVQEIQIGDGDTIATSDHVITWYDSTGLANGETLIIYPFKLYNASGVGDIKSMRFGHPEKSGVLFGNVKITGGSVPLVNAGTSTQVFRVDLTDYTGTPSVVVKLDWFDANVG